MEEERLLDFEDVLRGLGHLPWRCVRGQGDQHATTRGNIRNLRGPLLVIPERMRRGRERGPQLCCGTADRRTG
jgi:hypothetical protein